MDDSQEMIPGCGNTILNERHESQEAYLGGTRNYKFQVGLCAQKENKAREEANRGFQEEGIFFLKGTESTQRNVVEEDMFSV